VEEDHVVPEALFVNANQATVTVWSCVPCNREKSEGEGDLRDYLIITVGVEGHPDIVRLMEVMAEATDKGFSQIGQAATPEERRPALRRTAGGIDVPAHAVTFRDPRPLRRTLRYIVRGLYFHEFGRPWLPDQPMAIHDPPPSDLDGVLTHLRMAGQLEFRPALGNGVFKYAAVVQPEEPGVTIWAMVFFGVVPVIAFTGIAERKQQRRPPTFEETIRRKGRRERKLRDIVERGLVVPPPDNLLEFLRRHEEQIKKPRPG
jgi:hypothetical protein